MYYCEICKRPADKHHIIFKCEGGQDFPLNFKYLCKDHHRGKNGPHKNQEVNLIYRIELQDQLETLLNKEYYSLQKVSELIQLNKSHLKKLFKDLKLYKEGYKSKDIIYLLMGKNSYSTDSLDNFYISTVNF